MKMVYKILFGCLCLVPVTAELIIRYIIIPNLLTGFLAGWMIPGIFFFTLPGKALMLIPDILSLLIIIIYVSYLFILIQFGERAYFLHLICIIIAGIPLLETLLLY